MELKTTHPAFEPCSGTTVVPCGMSASRASLRGMPRVHPSHRTTSCFCLVPDKARQLGEGPAMQEAFIRGLALGFDAAPNVGQVFKDNCAPWFSRLNNVFTEHMITVAPKPRLLLAHVAQVALGTLGPGFLQGSSQFEAPLFDPSPTFLSQERIATGDSRLSNAQINAKDIVDRFDNGRWKIDHDMQPPGAIALNQVSGGRRITCVRQGIVRHGKRECQAALCGGQAYRLGIPRNFVGVHVVAWWAARSMWNRDLPTLAFQGQGAFNRLRRFDAGLNVQVTDERRRLSFTGIIGRVMQSNAVLFFMRQAIRTDSIERLCKEARGFGQGSSLFGSWVKFDAHRSVHVQSIPYTVRFCNPIKRTGGSGLSSAS